jgi:hypothetical protein
MTAYPLEYYLCLKGTPHIKIVDWNVPEIAHKETYHITIRHRQFTFKEKLFAKEYFGALLALPKDHKQHDLALHNSDQHLLLVLRFGEVEWLELGEDEALAMMQGELAS